MNQKSDLTWAAYIKNLVKRDGRVAARSKNGIPVTLEWSIRNAFDSDFYEILKESGTTSIDAFTKVEVDFLRAHPDVALQDEHFKLVAPLFSDAKNIDWNLVQEKMRNIIAGIYSMDCSSFGTDTFFIFVFIKDETTGEQLGSAQFFVEPTYAHGDVRLTSIAVKPKEQNRGLGKLLMCSIFKIVPTVQRIFLSTRITNEHAIRAYQNWGFTKDPNPVQAHFKFTEHWIHLEYKTDQSSILQKVAEGLK